jgi:hypothetical protein
MLNLKMLAINIQNAALNTVSDAHAEATMAWLKLTEDMKFGICGTHLPGHFDMNRVEGLTHPVRRSARPSFSNTKAGKQQGAGENNANENEMAVDGPAGPPAYQALF